MFENSCFRFKWSINWEWVKGTSWVVEFIMWGCVDFKCCCCCCWSPRSGDLERDTDLRSGDCDVGRERISDEGGRPITSLMSRGIRFGSRVSWKVWKGVCVVCQIHIRTHSKQVKAKNIEKQYVSDNAAENDHIETRSRIRRTTMVRPQFMQDTTPPLLCRDLTLFRKYVELSLSTKALFILSVPDSFFSSWSATAPSSALLTDMMP